MTFITEKLTLVMLRIGVDVTEVVLLMLPVDSLSPGIGAFVVGPGRLGIGAA